MKFVLPTEHILTVFDALYSYEIQGYNKDSVRQLLTPWPSPSSARAGSPSDHVTGAADALPRGPSERQRPQPGVVLLRGVGDDHPRRVRAGMGFDEVRKLPDHLGVGHVQDRCPHSKAITSTTGMLAPGTPSGTKAIEKSSSSRA